MATTDVSICNTALNLLGVEVISSFGDGTPQADLCKNEYTAAKEALLSRRQWRFCFKTVELSPAASAPVAHWENGFALPNDRVLDIPRAVFTSNDNGAPPVSDYAIEGGNLLTDYDTIYITYMYSAPEADFPPYFVDLLSYDLASRMAFPLTERESLAQYYHDLSYGGPRDGGFGGKYALAVAADEAFHPPRIAQPGPIYTARYEGIRGGKRSRP